MLSSWFKSSYLSDNHNYMTIERIIQNLSMTVLREYMKNLHERIILFNKATGRVLPDHFHQKFENTLGYKAYTRKLSQVSKVK